MIHILSLPIVFVTNPPHRARILFCVTVSYTLFTDLIISQSMFFKLLWTLRKDETKSPYDSLKKKKFKIYENKTINNLIKHTSVNLGGEVAEGYVCALIKR